MVLTAIPTAIHGRFGVFAGVHCRTDSLQVRISGHRRTAADASPVTYKQGVSSSSLLAPTLKAVDSRIGALEFANGAPSKETVANL
jgi:hypothetical protein